MRSLLLTPLFLLPYFFPILNAADSMDCFGRNAICSQANDLYDGCNSLLDGDTDKWFACLCGNGYVATDQACNWCQLAYTSSPIYTDVALKQCESNNVSIAPIPASIQAIASSFNATYTGFQSASPSPTSSPNADASTTNDGIAVPSKTKSSAPSQTSSDSSNDSQSSETSAATGSANDYETVTQTRPNSGTTSPTSPAQTDPASKGVSKSSGGLSTGAKAGIAIGCVLLVILILALIWIGIVLSRISKQRSQRNQNQGHGHVNTQGPVPDYAVQGQGIQEMGDTSTKVSFWPWGGGGKQQQNHQQQQQVPPYGSTPSQYVQSPPQMQNNNMTPPMNNNQYDHRRRSEMDGATIGGTVQGSPISPGVASPVSNASSPQPQMTNIAPPPPPQGQQQFQAYQPPPEQQNRYYPPPLQEQQGQYQAYQPHQTPQGVSELHGNEIIVPPGSGMPPEGR